MYLETTRLKKQQEHLLKYQLRKRISLQKYKMTMESPLQEWTYTTKFT